MTTADTSLVGALLERRYRVDKLLARGGMSSVYRGVDTRLDRRVAIKIMDPRFADDRSFVDRFEREARSAAKLHHPNVVAVHDQGVDTVGDNGCVFLVMELIDGGTVRDLMAERGGALDVALALSVAEPVLAALAAAHDAGLVHRDVKPENVLIGRNPSGAGAGVVKVGDFGLVRAVASAGTTSSSVILGTVAYLSPEQVTTGAAKERGDVYSAGILLYEMLTGQPPYTGDTALSVAYRHVNDDVPAPGRIRPGIPPALDDLVLRATRRDPAARPADAGAFLAELRRVRAELGLTAVPVPVPLSEEAPEERTDVDATRPAMAPVAGPSGPRGTRAMPRMAPPAAPVAAPTAMTAPVAAPPPPTGPQQAAAAAGPPPRKRGKTIALLAVAVLLLGGLIGTGVWWFSGGRYVAVPQVVGLDQPAAEKAMREVSLAPKFTKERNNTTPQGKVIRTDPGTGAQALQGDEVSVVLSLGRPTVPDIAQGTPVEDAKKAVTDQQLTLTRDSALDDYSDTVNKNTLLVLNPKAGTQLDIGGTVRFGVSKGPRPIPVPDVLGQSKDAAFAALRAKGFDPVDAGQEFSPDVAAGSVTRTDPVAGSTGGKRVNVWTSNAVEVPGVTGRTIEDAMKALTEAGLKPQRGNGDNGGDNGDGGDEGDGDGHGGGRKHGGFGFVIGQDPAAGTKVQKGSVVRLTTFP
ncbi:Stk1 family PASTA domain-containing Ser/Thr kinase [Amycolatopsis sp. CA-230715]|uniref:Stk1 family PASTA domain-containing Ser/Thr kinase n=1 Tax=Amycolatopsis sp. CA-230715 TaxID=2745196 RepID=UPI001C014254|nr:Stk1 family PASTA domain-containing Ser/Thr kinase [Amycolatopsis sp. CA-230715]